MCTFVSEYLQTEQLVNQQILISRLRSDLMTFQGVTSEENAEARDSGISGKRPYSAPLIRHSFGQGLPRKVRDV